MDYLMPLVRESSRVRYSVSTVGSIFHRATVLVQTRAIPCQALPPYPIEMLMAGSPSRLHLPYPYLEVNPMSHIGHLTWSCCDIYWEINTIVSLPHLFRMAGVQCYRPLPDESQQPFG